MSTVIITAHGSCYLGGCVYSMDCRVGVIPLLAFPVCLHTGNTNSIKFRKNALSGSRVLLCVQTGGRTDERLR